MGEPLFIFTQINSIFHKTFSQSLWQNLSSHRWAQRFYLSFTVATQTRGCSFRFCYLLSHLGFSDLVLPETVAPQWFEIYVYVVHVLHIYVYVVLQIYVLQIYMYVVHVRGACCQANVPGRLTYTGFYCSGLLCIYCQLRLWFGVIAQSSCVKSVSAPEKLRKVSHCFMGIS